MDSKKISRFADNYIDVYSEGIDEICDMTHEEHICGLIITGYRWAKLHEIELNGILGAVIVMMDMEEGDG